MRKDNIKGGSFLTIFDEDGNIYSSKKFRLQHLQMLFCASSGNAKTTAIECVTEQFHNEMVLVVILTEKERNPLEFGHAMFEPIEEYHLKMLEEIGKKPGKKTIKIYHPTVINEELKKNKQPPINFYSISIKDITKDELSLLLGVVTENEALTKIYNQIKRLNSNEGLFDLFYKLKKIFKKDTYERIREKLYPFEENYFLLSENNTMGKGLNYDEIINNQKDYHIFTYKWVTDEKLKYFLIMHNFQQIINLMSKSKYPVLFVIQEARNFLPEIRDIKEFYKIKMSEFMKKNLSELRNIEGVGGSTIADSQVFYDLEGKYRDSINATFFGRLSAGDLERKEKAFKFTYSQKKLLEHMPRGHFLLLQEKGKDKIIKFGMPTHSHAESGSFFKIYKKEFPKLMRDYSDLIKELKNMLIYDKNKYKEKIKSDLKLKREEEKKIEEEKESKIGLKKELEEVKELSSKDKAKAKELITKGCQEDYKKGKSFRKIGKKWGIDTKTAKKYALQGGEES